MAIVHRARLTPSKIELAQAWLDRQPWGGDGAPEQVGSYRFDDPDGEVGVEALLIRRGDEVLQVAMTYRSAPLAGGDDHLIGTLQHSVLGARWAYDAAYDPVGRGCFARSLAGDQAQAELEIWDGGRPVGHREPDVALRRVGNRTGPIAADDPRVRIGRVLTPYGGAEPTDTVALVADWSGGSSIVAVLGEGTATGAVGSG